MPAGGQRTKFLARGRGRGRGATSRRRTPERGWWVRPLRWWQQLNPKARWLGVAAGLVAAAGLTAGLLASSVGSPAVGERPYLSFTGCLLTDSDGINGQPAAAAWAGLQDAAAATRMQAQYLAVPASAPETAAGAGPYLASLVTQRCGLVVAAGAAQAAAVASDASRFKTVRFVVIGGAASGPNVTVVRGSAAAVRAEVDSLAKAALAGTS